MKGIVLAGGFGTRLKPLTNITNKHLLPVFDRPMIDYPLATLQNAGITEILIVSGREYAGDFLNYLGSGKERGLDLTYKVQEGAGGIAEALGLAEHFVGKGEKCAVILGDNIFENSFKDEVEKFATGAMGACVFYKEVDDPWRFGVIEVNKKGEPIRIVEKPKEPQTNFAVTGLYLYNSQVFEIIKDLKPSHRGELEITDVNNWYMERNWCAVQKVSGFWSDAGTFESLQRSSNFVEKKPKGNK